MNPPLLRSIIILIAVCTVFGFEQLATAQLPPELETRYKVDRVNIQQPFLDTIYARDLRVDLSDPQDPFAMAIGHFQRTDGVGAIGFIYDHFGTIDSSQPKRFYALDELPGTSYPPAWAGPTFISSKCFGMNSFGLVTGYLRDPLTNEHLAFYLDITDPDLEIKEIPKPAGSVLGDHWFSGTKVNEIGQILVRYHDEQPGSSQFVFEPMSNDTTEIPVDFSGGLGPVFSSLEVIGTSAGEPGIARRYNLLTGSTDQLTDDSLGTIDAVNDVGQFIGLRSVVSGRGKKRKEENFVTRYSGDLQTELDVNGMRAYSLNLSGDFTFDTSVTSSQITLSEIFLLQDDWGVLELESLVPDADSQNNNETSDVFKNAEFIGDPRLSNRDQTGFGWIFCSAAVAGDTESRELFLLIPNVPGQTPGITVSPTNDLVTTEAGGTDTFTVALSTQPTDDVTIGIRSSNLAAGTVSPASVTFTDADWGTPQTITVSGLNDSLEYDVAYTIITDPAESLDPDYDHLNADDVQVTNEDDDSPSGGGTEVYSNGTSLGIPDRGMRESTIDVNDDYQIVDMTVTLSISHPRPADLKAYLVGPNSEEVRLFNLTGDNPVSDFNGISTDRIWTLKVYDSRKKKTGTINGWSMTVDY